VLKAYREIGALMAALAHLAGLSVTLASRLADCKGVSSYQVALILSAPAPIRINSGIATEL
jgi:hypothetical protein